MSQNAVALAAIDKAREDGRVLWISRQVLREYLGHPDPPQAFRDVPKAMVLEQVRLFQEHFEIADDIDAVTEQLMQLMDDIPIGANRSTMPISSPLMLAYGIPALLTHNGKDFERFADRIVVESIRLLKPKQKFVMEMIDAVLQQEGQRG